MEWKFEAFLPREFPQLSFISYSKSDLLFWALIVNKIVHGISGTWISYLSYTDIF